MATENVTNFNLLVEDIEEKNILLPDFQRDFVWKDEEKQKKIVASVLTKMPIGSILLLSSDADQYCSKIIGGKAEVDTSSIRKEVMVLIDGQQRITVLANVFSNVIHDNCPRPSDLVSASLKRRFFLRIPSWKSIYEGQEMDLFGVKKLSFPLSSPATDIPEFHSSDILEYIEAFTYSAKEKKPYDPHVAISTNLDDFCLYTVNGYLIPLYLLIPTGNNSARMQKRFKDIRDAIGTNIRKEIISWYNGLTDQNEKCLFIQYILSGIKGSESEIKSVLTADNMDDEFEYVMDSRKDNWIENLKKYLDSCIDSVILSQIKVDAKQRARAIDIYENLNMGGVSLSTFDLIMAKVAKVDKKNFLQRIKDEMCKKKIYPDRVLTHEIKPIIQSLMDAGAYNATLRTECISSKNEELNSKYVDAFLDVLSLYCKNPEGIPSQYKIDHIKKEVILKLEAEEIHENCEHVILALDRAMFFFQTRCGIRHIKEINYNLMIVLVATVFANDAWYYDPEVHNLLEAWYWSVLFSGEYDKDQNAHMISNLQNMTRRIRHETDIEWLDSISRNVLSMPNFSDRDLLLMKKAQEDRFPKAILRNFICQYLLSNTYMDMFDPTKRISVFCEDANELEAHHIIPLGSVKKVGETTAALRNKAGHICNSPLNFVYITKTANKEISSDSLETYEKKVQVTARSELHILAFAVTGDDKVTSILDSRYNMIKGDITSEINRLLLNWR